MVVLQLNVIARCLHVFYAFGEIGCRRQQGVGDLKIALDPVQGADDIDANFVFGAVLFALDYPGGLYARLDIFGNRKDVVTTLRSKIEPDMQNPAFIHTLREVGYKFQIL